MQSAMCSASRAAAVAPTTTRRRPSTGRRTGAMPTRCAGINADVVEPATKVSFPNTLGGTTLKCIGAGVREKKVAFINVKVYGVAMYVDPAACKAELTAGKSLLDGAFDKALLVQMVRDVGRAPH